MNVNQRSRCSLTFSGLALLPFRLPMWIRLKIHPWVTQSGCIGVVFFEVARLADVGALFARVISEPPSHSPICR